MLVEAVDVAVLDGGLEKGVEHVEAGAVSGEPGAGNLHSAERADVDPAVRLPAPGTSPVLELVELTRSAVNEEVNDVLLAEPVAAGDGVNKVLVEAVIVTVYACGAAFCCNSVAAHGVYLGNQSHVKIGGRFCHGNCRTQSGSAGTDNGDVRFYYIQFNPPGTGAWASAGLTFKGNVTHYRAEMLKLVAFYHIDAFSQRKIIGQRLRFVYRTGKNDESCFSVRYFCLKMCKVYLTKNGGLLTGLHCGSGSDRALLRHAILEEADYGGAELEAAHLGAP